MIIRRDVASLSEHRFDQFVGAVKALNTSNNPTYQNLVRTHFAQRPLVHNTPLFLPWHRAFLLKFESLLRAQLPLEKDFALPYWNWINDAGAGNIGRLWWPIRMGKAGNPVSDGQFRSGQWTTYDMDGKFPSPWLIRTLGTGLSPDNFPTRRTVLDLLNLTEYDDFRVKFERGVHGYIHDWVGGQMGWVPASVNDPVFWLHHANVDRLWAEWERINPEAEIKAATFPSFGRDTLMPPTYLEAGGATVASVLNRVGIDYTYDSFRLICVHSGTYHPEETPSPLIGFAESKPATWDPAIYKTRFREAVYPAAPKWESDTKFDKASRTRYGVALTTLGSRLYCVHSGFDDGFLQWTRTENPSAPWQADQKFGNDNPAENGVALATFGNTVYCVHRGDGDPGLYWTTYNLDKKKWEKDEPFTQGNLTSSGVALAVLGGKMYCVHRGFRDASLWWTVFDPANRTWDKDLEFTQGNLTNGAVALAVYKGKLYCVHDGYTDTLLYWTTFDPDKKIWEKDETFGSGNRARFGVALAVLNNVLYCVHRGGGDANLWWTTFDPDHKFWGEDKQFTENNRAGYQPGLTVFFEH
jgi:hypothetical protein